jgi:opacity protein-like surface antigen
MISYFFKRYLLLIGIISTTLSYNVFAKDVQENWKSSFYIGPQIGISNPIIKKISEGIIDVSLKNSQTVGGRIGYEFYPNMKLELSAVHQAKFEVNYEVPNNPLTSDLGDKTKVSGNMLALNLLYDLSENFCGVKPYVMLGFGVANILIKPQNTSINVTGYNVNVMDIYKTNMNCFAMQFGGGISRNLTDNFSIDCGLRVQYIKNVKIQYASQAFNKSGVLKTDMGLAEVTLGFLYKLPI